MCVWVGLVGSPYSACPTHTAVSTWPSARVLSFCCTPPLPLAGVSMSMERGCQQNDSLAVWLVSTGWTVFVSTSPEAPACGCITTWSDVC